MALDETGGDGKPTCVQGYKAFCCKSGQLDPGMGITVALSLL